MSLTTEPIVIEAETHHQPLPAPTSRRRRRGSATRA